MKSLPPYLEKGSQESIPNDSDTILKTIFQIFPDLLFYIDEHGVIINYLASDSVSFYLAPEECLGRQLIDVLPTTTRAIFKKALAKTTRSGEISSQEYKVEANSETHWYVAKFIQIKTSHIVVVIRDITDQKRSNEILLRQQKMMGSLQESARQFVRELDSKALGANVTRCCVDQFGVNEAWLGLIVSDLKLEDLGYSSTRKSGAQPKDWIKPTPGEVKYLNENRLPLIIENNRPEIVSHQTRALFPLLLNNHVLGILAVSVDVTGFFSPDVVDFFQAFILLAGSSIQNARLYENSRRQLSQMQTLRSIDQAILSNLDMNSMTALILMEAAKHIHADALALLVLDPKTQMLDFVNGFGFRHDTFKHSHLKIGESFAGQVALQKRTIHVENLMDDPGNFSRAASFKDEGFMMYLGTPLIARSEVRGVLEIFQRRPFEMDEDWVNLLETLANQIAIAIDNALLVKFLRDSNKELHTAYDATIEGLSGALELRDHDTQGHTCRVAGMTDELARRMGIPDTDLFLIHQGALLHDIGKMGIPDAILLKPGELLPEEWDIMKQHPLYAYQLLSQVEHLKRAMDIPLYHHEKWDGTGYPYGLKGEQIPAAARLFSIVDVFDALTSDRPYRSAWTKEKALAYVQAQSGTQFDPAIVPVFKQMIMRESSILLARDGRAVSKSRSMQFCSK